MIFDCFNMKKIIFLTNVCLLLLAAIPCLISAQEPGYQIGPRDVISIDIYAGGEKQQAVVVSVDARGMINVPFIGPLKVDGLTLSELRSLIAEPLAADYFVNPEVILHVKEYKNLYYYISGAVTSPGLYETSSKITLMQLIAKAGGVLPSRGDVGYILRNAAQQIQDGKNLETLMSEQAKEEVDLKKLLEQVDMSQNVQLQSGDVVYISVKDENEIEEEKPSVYVEGEVKSPGAYVYKHGMTALNACILAGGFSKYAAPNRTRIIRKKDGRQLIIEINLDEVKKGIKKDVEIEPGDLIHVPESWF
ncbi:MAG: polysaccharide biosynthesis/export family protein [Desulfobacterales bacterium]